MKQIEINKNHIDNFVLETEEGTKRTKEKFYEKASNDRNNYVNEQHILFDKYKVLLENEMRLRFKNEMPIDKTEEYNKQLEEVDQLLNVVKLNSDISDSFKLKLDFVIASIKEETSLEDLDNILLDFINRFKEYGVSLTIEDFKYTMFTERYMSTLLKNPSPDVMKDVFEKIYFACPMIKKQLKMNLRYIVNKYKDKLNKYVGVLKEEEFKKHEVNDGNVISKYTAVRYDIGNRMAMDEYYNAKIFLDAKKKITDYLVDSPARAKNYNTFAINGDYAALDDVNKQKYNSATMGLYLTLNELKKYYNYEFILKDLLERYKNKDSVKNQYTSKKKEAEKEEKVRQSIYKKYLKASGVGFLAKQNEVKMKDEMLKMNEQIKKLIAIYDELEDLEITFNLSKLNEAASIYDLYYSALSSFDFLEKSFSSDEKFEEHTLEENINDYFKFLYNPNNSFLRKINALTEFDIISIVAEKYKLLNLAITNEVIDQDNIDATLDTVKFINLVQNIERSNITIQGIANLCKMQDVVKVDEEETEVV